MTRVSKLSAFVGLVFLGVAIWFFTRPVIILSGDSSIWASEDNAVCQGTIYPGPAEPKKMLKQGDKIRILWIKYGKDYGAAFVVAPGFQKGWILTTQKGIPG